MKAMNKVASHINEMQKLHEEYGAVFDLLINEQTADKKEVNTVALSESSCFCCFYSTIGSVLRAHVRWLTSRWGICCCTAPWCGSTLQPLWSRARRTPIWLLLVSVLTDFCFINILFFNFQKFHVSTQQSPKHFSINICRNSETKSRRGFLIRFTRFLICQRIQKVRLSCFTVGPPVVQS